MASRCRPSGCGGRGAGFYTGGIWRNGWVGSNFGFNQGFDLYVRPIPNNSREEMELRRRNPGVGVVAGTDEDGTLSAIEFLDAHRQDRFFLYVHYMDVHQYVYDQTAAELRFGNGLSDAYDSAINWVDRNIGWLIHEIEKRNLFRKTIVVVSADHGEGFTEHGGGHARTLYGELPHVPWIIALPFRLDEW